MNQTQVRQHRTATPFETLRVQQVPPSAFRQPDKSLVGDEFLRGLFSPTLKARMLSRPNMDLSSNRGLLSNHPAELSGVYKNETSIKSCENAGDGCQRIHHTRGDTV